MYQRILVAVTPETYRGAVSEALKFSAYPDVKFRFVHVVEVLVNAAEGLNVESIYLARAEQGKRLLDSAVALAHEHGVEPETALIDGIGRRIDALLREEVAAWLADLVVLGARHRNPLVRLFSDDIPDAVVTHGSVPVLLVGVQKPEPVRASSGGSRSAAQ